VDTTTIIVAIIGAIGSILAAVIPIWLASRKPSASPPIQVLLQEHVKGETSPARKESVCGKHAPEPKMTVLPPSGEQWDSARQGKQDSSISSAQLAAGAPVSNSESRELATVADILNKDPRWEVVARKRDNLDFVPKEWLEWLPQLGINAASRSWIYVCLHSEEGRLYYAVEVAPMKDLAKRIEIVTKLLDECSRFGFKRPKRSKDKEVKNNYSRISTAESILEWEKEAEPKPEVIRSAVKKMLDDLYPKLENLTSILKPLCELRASTT
jgi:hypothetical protein